ncbi:MAG: response regulator transcription factor [Microbacteriaceae bacterium]|jgi:DNA-binding CsgD family transcriptional regulator|nr:response regulator transcription factor [Microbacteriaceae bacterium]MCI1207082.1 response regulator transcription factor [Microbacteriaceae bacterium]
MGSSDTAVEGSSGAGPNGSDPEHLRSGTPVRERMLSQIESTYPLTILSGLPGTGKVWLLRQWFERLPQAASSFLIDLPSRPLPPSQVLAFVLQRLARGRQLGEVGQRRLDQLRRGNLDLFAFEAEMPELLSPWSTGLIVLTRYEWQACPVLDHVIITAVRMGFNIVCSLIDGAELAQLAATQGVSCRLIEDADLNFTADETGLVAERMGWELSPKVLARVTEATAGNPALTTMTLLCLGGLQRVVSARSTSKAVWSPPADAGLPEHRVPDASEVTEDLVAQAAGLLLHDRDSPALLMGTPQTVEGFMAFLRVLIPFHSAPMRALTELWPGAAAFIHRLCGARYGHLEYDGADSGIFVWTPECRAAFQRFLPDTDPDASAFADRLIEWEATHGAYREALELRSRFGGPEDLEQFCREHFLDLLWDGHVAEFLNELGHRRDPQMFPITVLLSVITRLGADLTGIDRVRVGEAAEVIRRRMTAGANLEEAEALPDLLCTAYAITLLRAWTQMPDLESRIVPRLRRAELLPEADPDSLAKTAFAVGLFALIRVRTQAAKALLSLSMRMARSAPLVSWTTTALGVLGGILGEQLVTGQQRQAPLEETGLEDAAGLQRIFLRLNEIWGPGLLERPEQNLARITQIVEDAPALRLVPIVAMTLQFLQLSAGNYEEAFQISAPYLGHPQVENSPRWELFVFGTVLAAIRTGRLTTARDMAEFLTDTTPVGAIVHAMIFLIEGRTADALSVLSDVRLGPESPTRLRAGLLIFEAALNVREGHVGRARSILLELLASVPDSEMRVVLRLLSVSDVRDLAELLPPSAVTWKRLFQESAEEEHLLPESRPGPELSLSELEVLRGVARGLTNRGIAMELFLSPNTVKTHLRRIFRELDVDSRTEAVARARQLGLLSRPEG